MKKFIQWLAKVFNANITKEVTKVVEVEKKIYLTSGTIEGNINVEGNLSVNGTITATGGITCLKGGRR